MVLFFLKSPYLLDTYTKMFSDEVIMIPGICFKVMGESRVEIRFP